MSRPKRAAAAEQLQFGNKAAIYLRVSSEEQATEGFGLDAQREQCEAYAKAFGLQVVQVFEDAGISGAKDTIDRPGLAAMLAGAAAGEFETVIFAALDRLARRASLALRLWDLLEASHITIVAVKERADTSTPAGRLLRTMLAGIAEFERDTIAGRLHGGRRQRSKVDGRGSGPVPFGYVRSENGGVEVDPSAAAAVRRLLELRSSHTYGQTAIRLNEEGHPAPRGQSWTISAVQGIERNRELYTSGRRRWDDVTAEAAWPAIT